MIKKTGLWFCCAMAFAAVPVVAEAASLKGYSGEAMDRYVEESVRCFNGEAAIKSADQDDVFTTIKMRVENSKDEQPITCDDKGFYLAGRELTKFAVVDYSRRALERALPFGITKECIGDQYYLITHMPSGRALFPSGITAALKNGQPEQCSQN